MLRLLAAGLLCRCTPRKDSAVLFSAKNSGSCTRQYNIDGVLALRQH